MNALVALVQKALGGPDSALWKRYSAAHRAGVTKVATHVGRAMAHHKEAMGHYSAARKAAGDAMENCAKALEHVSKAHEMCAKAAGGDLEHHMKEAKGFLTKAIKEHMASMGQAHKAASEEDSSVQDQHELAKGALIKVASSWVGEHSETPATAGPGYDPAQAGHVTLSSQSDMTEGEVPDTDSDEPLYDWKGLGVRTGGGGVTEAEVRMREKIASQQAEIDGLKKAVETIGNQPGNPKGHLFPPVGGAGDNAHQPSRGSLEALVKDAREKGVISDIEWTQFMQNPDKQDLRQRISRKILGHQASALERRDPSFAKGLTDPTFRGDAEAVARRTAAGASIFRA